MIRYQKNITITKEQEDYARANYGKITNRHIARAIGVGYGKTLANLRVMGLYRPSVYNGIVVKMEGYFNVDEFKKYYNY